MFENKIEGKKYIQLYNYYKNLIVSGVMEKNSKIPSIRKCAESFELSRTTVETAYEMLAAEGYIISKAQSGFYVCDGNFQSFEVYENFSDGNNNRKKIKYDMVSVSGDKESFNFSVWRRYVKSALRQDERLLSYGEYQGEYDLREAICSYVNKERGVVCSPRQVVVAAGTQNLISILCALTPERKDVIFIGEDFEQGRAVFEDHGKITSVNALSSEINDNKTTSSLLYISPSHIDNKGNVLTSKSRIDILKFAADNDCLIVEDDYDSEFRYYSRPLPSLQGMNGGKNVVYIGTFSKLLIPSIRISFMIMPLNLIEKYNERGKLYNQTASKAEQIALCQYIRDGHLSAQIRKQRKHYAFKTKQFCKKANEMYKNDIEFSECHTSYLIKASVITDKSAEYLIKKALENGILIKSAGKEEDREAFILSVSGFNLDNLDDFLEKFRVLTN